MKNNVVKLESNMSLGDSQKKVNRIRVSCPWGTLEIENSATHMDYDNEDYPCPTMKDISIFLYHLCGQGVTWQFAYELEKHTGIDAMKLDIYLMDIMSRYAKMDDSTAIKEYERITKIWKDRYQKE